MTDAFLRPRMPPCITCANAGLECKYCPPLSFHKAEVWCCQWCWELSRSVRLHGFSLCFFVVSPLRSCCFIHFPSVRVCPLSAGSVRTTDGLSAVVHVCPRPVTRLQCFAFHSSYCPSASCRLLIVFITLLIVSFISPHM